MASSKGHNHYIDTCTDNETEVKGKARTMAKGKVKAKGEGRRKGKAGQGNVREG